MPQFVKVLTAYSANSFVEGRPVRLFVKVKLDDDVVQAECTRLCNLGLEEAALDLLNDWCARKRVGVGPE